MEIGGGAPTRPYDLAMEVGRLSLRDFRSYREVDLDLAPGVSVFVGDNGQGKTNLLEAVGYLATLSSFRGAPAPALVRDGAPRAVMRAAVSSRGRVAEVAAELPVGGRGRVQVNGQRLPRSRDLLGVLRVSVFTPDDLALVKGGPAERRRFLDDVLVACAPRHDAVRSEFERVIRQRSALLRQAGGRLTPEIEQTLEVWDEKLVTSGEELTRRRLQLIDTLAPAVAGSYAKLAEVSAEITLQYESTWLGTGLRSALEAARRDDLRRGSSTVGPHRDDLLLSIGELPTRTHASQGEQRTLALALRLAAHGVVSDASGAVPVLLLDDIFSELDPGRAERLVRHLPDGQVLLTTASGVPEGVVPDAHYRVAAGRIVEVGGNPAV